MDHEMAQRDDATNRQAMAKYIASLDADSPDADIARRDAENDARAMAEYMDSLDARDQMEYGACEWLYRAEAMQADYRDAAETERTLRQF